MVKIFFCLEEETFPAGWKRPAKRMAKIYTKTGDKGETGLVGGKRISKGALRLEAYGDVDELNAVLGVAASFLSPKDEDLKGIVRNIQDKLFVVGANLATPPDYKGSRFVPNLEESDVIEIEESIDKFEADLPPLKNFILPSGSTAGSFFHLSRTVCRRAERNTVRLSQDEPITDHVVKYLNRLSDFLFVLARTINKRATAPEIPWNP
jgi:cob(I)alamin adenosyltransferase